MYSKRQFRKSKNNLLFYFYFIILIIQFNSDDRSQKQNKNTLIKCTVDVEGSKIQQNFLSTTPIKEVKRSLKNKYKQLGHKTKNIDNEIIFYCDGKPITNENEQIGNLTEGAEMNFEILSVSLSDNNSSSNDTYKIQEKIVNKVSRE